MDLTVESSNRVAHERLAAIVLAAGDSSRMGSLKPLLPLAGVTALERCISLFRNAGIDDVLVVLGNRAEEVRPLAQRSGARCVFNPACKEGMYSSVLAGAGALPQSARGVFVLPADVPLVGETTIRELAAASSAHPGAIVYPVFAGRRGHPPLIPRAILDEGVQGAAGPLSALLRAHEKNAVDIAVADEAIHRDMDTPADLEALQLLAELLSAGGRQRR